MKNRRRAVFSQAKRAGISAEQVWQVILDACVANTSAHAPAENAMNQADALMVIEEVYGKRARKRCETIGFAGGAK